MYIPVLLITIVVGSLSKRHPPNKEPVLLQLSHVPIDTRKGKNDCRQITSTYFILRRHMEVKSLFSLKTQENNDSHSLPNKEKTAPLLVHGYPNVDFIFKNEAATRTGSLKHRYAWSLMMWAVVEGKIKENTTIYEASSGNTAASEAYMCRLIGNKFIAIVPDTIEHAKVEHIESFGGSVIKVPIGQRLVRAAAEAKRHGGYFMNQFAHADRAEEYHESGNYPFESANLMHEILHQMKHDLKLQVKAPHYFVHSAGTGGTISSVGRYTKRYGLPTEIVLADTEFSVYYDYVIKQKFKNESGEDLWVSPGLAGVGFGPMGAVKHGLTSSLTAAVIDRVVKVPDLAATAAMEVLRRYGINGGTSTGINFLVALHLAATKRESPQFKGQKLTIATLLGDSGQHYEVSYYNLSWIAQNFALHGGLDVYECWIKEIRKSMRKGSDPLMDGSKKCSKPVVDSVAIEGSMQEDMIDDDAESNDGEEDFRQRRTVF
ncbi:hypothetical protein AB6A40_002056 [Gnathostoma spinigerum]|uniref:Tryptophan synthase beta chain-like PALP domain-containing protein n=1 Tax=Gnathostoma spinigerum TaxID=75299 RepID=A0ABD6EF98_9BILA